MMEKEEKKRAKAEPAHDGPVKCELYGLPFTPSESDGDECTTTLCRECLDEQQSCGCADE